MNMNKLKKESTYNSLVYSVLKYGGIDNESFPPRCISCGEYRERDDYTGDAVKFSEIKHPHDCPFLIAKDIEKYYLYKVDDK